MSDSSDDEFNEIQKYTLIEFIHRGRKRKIKDIDIVPSSWLEYDKKRGRCVTKFLDSMDNPINVNLLHNLIKSCSSPKKDWPVFSVELKGRAKTYEEALKKLERLKVEENVFTLESEESASELQNKLKYAVKQKKLLSESKKLEDYFSSPTIEEKKSSDSEDDSVRKNTNSKQRESSIQSELANNQAHSSNAFQDMASWKDDSNEFENLTMSEPISKELYKTSDKNVLVELQNIPVIDVPNVQCNSDFEQAVILQLGQLNQENSYIKSRIDDIVNFLIDKKLVGVVNSKHTVDFEKKYNFILPITSVENFDKFDQVLEKNDLLKHDVCIELSQCVDKDYVLTRSFVKMLKTFLTKEVAVKFTSVRKSADKESRLFKSTQLCRCMDAVLIKSRKSKNLDISEKDLITALSDVLCNAKNWKKP